MRTVEETCCPCQLARSTPNVHTVHDTILSLHCTHANILLSDLPGQVKRGWNTSWWLVVECKSIWVIELIALSTFHPHTYSHYRRGTTETLFLWSITYHPHLYRNLIGLRGRAAQYNYCCHFASYQNRNKYRYQKNLKPKWLSKKININFQNLNRNRKCI